MHVLIEVSYIAYLIPDGGGLDVAALSAIASAIRVTKTGKAYVQEKDEDPIKITFVNDAEFVSEEGASKAVIAAEKSKDQANSHYWKSQGELEKVRKELLELQQKLATLVQEKTT